MFNDIFAFGNHHGATLWQIRSFTVLLLAVALWSLPVYILRFYSDYKKLNLKTISIETKTDLKDRIFGWTIAIIIIIVEFSLAITKLI